MKKFTRFFSFMLVLVVLMSTMAVAVSAYETNSGSNGSVTGRTIWVYHSWGSEVKLERLTQGAACDLFGTKYYTYGTYTYKVYNSSGKLVSSDAWNANRSKSTSVMSRWCASGRYRIVISATPFPNAACSYWNTYPKYNVTYK